VKYILPKRRFDLRSADACAEVIHCWVMSTWQLVQVWADWGFIVLRIRGGGVYAEAARARATSAGSLKYGIG
jgi:hypothetical protein